MPEPPRPPASFPEGFLWGAATSAYQVEGSPLADGAGASIWHRFSRVPGNITNGDTGDLACDHYRRWPEDLAWMRRMGLGAYRLSVSWSRILPEGRGRVNLAGLDFYARLVDALLEAGIAPMLTLYHWDLPAALDDRGGWTNPDIEGWFGDYASVVFDALGDRVPLWATINEPWVIVDGGYLHGALAPGRRGAFEAARAAHHVLLAHGAAVRAFRARASVGPGTGRIGIVVNLEPKDPASDRPEDVAATARVDAQMNRHYLDALFLGRYPAELAGIYGEGWPAFPDEDFARLGAPMDFVGVNYYTRALTEDDPTAWPTSSRTVRNPDAEYSDLDWEIHPAALTRVLKWVRDRYTKLPLYVTENGCALPEASVLAADVRRLDDPRRVEYLRSHVGAVRDALAAGVDVRGYFAWSLLDNLEWGHGFSKRFGVLHVDHASQKRTPKSSASFLRALAVSNGRALDEAARSADWPDLPEPSGQGVSGRST
jgi:beta-glucosidase